jgi:hypothetical protein
VKNEGLNIKYHALQLFISEKQSSVYYSDKSLQYDDIIKRRITALDTNEENTFKICGLVFSFPLPVVGNGPLQCQGQTLEKGFL